MKGRDLKQVSSSGQELHHDMDFSIERHDLGVVFFYLDYQTALKSLFYLPISEGEINSFLWKSKVKASQNSNSDHWFYFTCWCPSSNLPINQGNCKENLYSEKIRCVTGNFVRLFLPGLYYSSDDHSQLHRWPLGLHQLVDPNFYQK